MTIAMIVAFTSGKSKFVVIEAVGLGASGEEPTGLNGISQSKIAMTTATIVAIPASIAIVFAKPVSLVAPLRTLQIYSCIRRVAQRLALPASGRDEITPF